MTRKKPHVTLKLAVTLDGKIATRNGHSHWVTGSVAREWVHYQRAGVQVLLTSAATVMADNPQLTVRHWAPTYGTSRPIRVILDRRFRLNPKDYRIFNTQEAPTLVMTSPQTKGSPHRAAAEAMGVQVVEVPETSYGLNLSAIFTALYDQKLYSVWVEAGGQLAGALVEGGWVQRLHWVMAGKLLSDPQSRLALVGSLPQWTMEEARRLSLRAPVPLGEDWLVTATCTGRT